MTKKIDITALNNKIQKTKLLLNELKKDADDFPALLKNSKRALASLKMMELNISDLIEFGIHETSG